MLTALLLSAAAASPAEPLRGPAGDLAAFLETPAVCGFEEALIERIATSLPPDLTTERDALGSLIVRPDGPDAAVARLIAVGIDEPGYVVSGITEDGYLRLRTLGARGGEFHEQREGRPTTVWTRRGPLAGVILVDSTHLGARRPAELGEEHLFVDVGADTLEEARAIGVELLDPVVWREVTSCGERLVAPAAGARAAAWALVHLLHHRADELSGQGYAFAFVAQSRLRGGRLGRGMRVASLAVGAGETLVLRARADLDTSYEGPHVLDEARRVAALDLRAFDIGAPTESVSISDAERFHEALAQELLGAALPFEGHAVAEADPPSPAYVPGGHTEAAGLLERLVRARGVSGHEAEVREAILAEIARIDPNLVPEIDGEGNVLLELGEGARTLVFVAHMDEVGLAVTRVRADGLLETRARGGFYRHLYLASPVEVLGREGVVAGVTRPEADGNALLVDVGAASAEEVRALGVAPGAPLTEPKTFRRLGLHRAAGRALDDRVGCTALLLALRQLASQSLDRRVVLAWVVREEVGLEGSGALAERMDPAPELVFPIDTFVSSDSPRDDPRFAYAKLGAGPVLRALDSSSITPRAWVDRLREIASDAGPHVQLGTTNGGNDGSPFVPRGTVDCPLAWPQRCSHSRVETMDLRDLETLSRLVAAVAARI